MPRLAWPLGTAVLVVTLHLHAQAPAPQPVFRGGTDLVQVDVSVLDSKRHPVRGLTAADFTVLEDGEPRKIQAFAEVDLADNVRAAGTVSWNREVPPDVVTNQSTNQEGRIVIIFLDRTIPIGEPTVTARRIATAIVNALGPDDLGAVVSSSGGDTQNLTTDRARLLRAVNRSDLSTGISPEAREIEERMQRMVNPDHPPLSLLSALNDGRCMCGVCVLDAITQVAEAVQDTPRRRKSLFFIGADLRVQSGEVGKIGVVLGDGGCEQPLRDARTSMFAALARANVTVHSLDPSGLANISPATRTSSTLRGGEVQAEITRNMTAHLQRQGALKVLPDLTGGRAVMNTNAPDLQVSNIFHESDSYYLLGFRPVDAAANGKFHAITVKANRRGLDVRARSGYTAASAPAGGASTPAANLVPQPLREAMSGLLPSSRLPIDVNAATFAAPGSGKAAVVLSVGVSAFASVPGTDAGAREGGALDVVAGAFNRGGRAIGTSRQPLELTWPSTPPTEDQRFEALSRLDLAPGEYEIRVGVSGAAPARTASVFAYVTVPAFASAPLSLSSIVIGATAGTLTAPKNFLAALLPIVPTARRDFARVDRPVAFLRVYQGTSRHDPLLPVQLRSSLLDAQGKIVADQPAVLPVAQFEKERTADHYVALPLATLSPGEYLLRIEASMGDRTAGRAVRFSVR